MEITMYSLCVAGLVCILGLSLEYETPWVWGRITGLCLLTGTDVVPTQHCNTGYLNGIMKRI